MTVYVYGPKDKIPEEHEVINTTSRSATWSKQLSPFFLGPCDLYDGMKAKNVENAWQYSKVYKKHLNSDGSPSEQYFKWAKMGWDNQVAVRYPMGRGAIPEYSYWNGEKLDYISARKKIYIPLYGKSVMKSDAYNKLKEIYNNTGVLHLWDFDGYNYIKENVDLKEVINNPNRKMGHAFVLAILLMKGY
jgi:hypothetical protein